MKRSTSHPSTRRLASLAAALGVAAMLLVGCSGGGDDAPTDDAPAGDAAELVAADNEWVPTTLTLPIGANDITITNEGSAVHNFIVEGGAVETDLIQPGDTVTVTVTVPEGGVDFNCSLHPEMTGTIEVAA